MRKKRTRKPFSRWLRQGIALFVAAAALWLVWLTGDPAATLSRLAGSTQLATALLAAELGVSPQDGADLSGWDRLVLAQSSLLSGILPKGSLTTPEEEPSPQLEPSPEVTVEPDPLPSATEEPDGIIPRTMVAGTSASYVNSGSVSIYNHTDYTLDIDQLLADAPALTAGSDAPQVLIFHSHATEAYTPSGTDVYEESDSYRTLNTDQNMVRVGEEMAKIFEDAGIEVIHDTTLYDYPSYNEAYNRSSAGVAHWLEEYPSIQLVLDVHRDALAASDGTIYKTVAGTVENCAQVMMVMGSDAMGQEHPNWRINLSLATSIQKALADKWSTLARPLVLRTSRFNQHQSTGEILLEVGTHGNTLQEAITAARLYARTVADMMTGKD